jgi:uncharacterized repeat protein (TIGR02543 family)
MKKKITALVLFILMVLCVLPATALAATGDTGKDTDTNYTWKELSGGTVEVTGFDGTLSGDIVIPGTLSGKTVTGIGNSAFPNKAITSIEIPASVTYIGSGAFASCSQLSAVTFSGTSALKTIGESSFSPCTSLESITLPASLESIGGSAFFGDTSLEAVAMGNNVTAINGAAFNGCSKLSSVTFSDNLLSIGESAFLGTALTSIDIPGSVQTIGTQAFISLPLTSVNLNEGLVTIGQAAFMSTSITEITIPSTVTAINQAAFATCASLTKATILNSAVTFGSGAFGSDTCSIYGFAGSTAQTYASGADGTFTFHTIYKVTFDSLGGSDVDWGYAESGGKVSKPTDPARTGYVFAGWFKDKTLSDVWTFSTDTVTKDITLYAKWYYHSSNGRYYAGNEYDQLRKFLDSPSASEGGYTNGRLMHTEYTANRDDPDYWYNMNWADKTEGSYTVYYANNIYWNDGNNCPYLNGNLDLSNFKYLEKLIMDSSQIDSLKVNNDTALTNLECSFSNTADDEGNTVNTGITSLDLSTCTALKEVDIRNNWIGGELDLSKNTALETLNCGGNQIEKLDLNSAALKTVRCNYNNLESLDTSSAGTSLTELDCSYNELTSLILTGNTKLTDLECSSNKLSVLNASGLNSLQYLYCSDNKLTSLVLTGCTGLSQLDCSKNNLSALATGDCTMLVGLSCPENEFTGSGPDLSANTYLTQYDCSKNQIDSLSLSANTNLSGLACSSNKLTGLSVSANTILAYLDCSDNQIDSLILNTGIERLNCGKNKLTALNTSVFTGLEMLLCYGNDLVAIDVSNNTGLEYLDCGDCGLSSLNISANTELEALICDNNSLSSLDLSHQPGLYQLSCSGNQLTSLDTRGYVYEVFKCTGNPLTYIKANANGWEEEGPFIIELKAKGDGYIGLDFSEYEEDNPFVLAAPKTDRAFANWTDSKGKILARTAKYDIDYDKAYSLTANFDNLAIPSNVIAAGTAYNKINISWDAVTGATGYKIYRATSESGKYTLIKTTAAVSYINTGVTTGRTYYYKVAAYDKKHTGYSSAPVSAATILGQVTGAAAVSYYPTSVKITWNAVSGASSYSVYSCDSEGGIIKKLGSTSSKSFTKTGLTPYQTYNFTVKAFRGSASGDYSDVKSATPLVGQVTNVKTASASQTSVIITWSAVAGATKYVVSRSDTEGGTYTDLTPAVSSKSFTDTGRTFGQTYYYKVKAYTVVSKTPYYGDYSLPVPATAGQVTGVKATSSYPTKAVISWSKIKGATEYHVSRCDTAGGTYTDLKTVTSSSYTDTDLTPGDTYYYKVTAYFGTTAGEASAYVSVKPDIAQVKGVKAVRSNLSKLKITWKAVAGASYYKVYVSTDGSAYSPLPNVVKTYCYYTPAPKTASGYYFKIVAYASINGTDYNGAESAVYHMTK